MHSLVSRQGVFVDAVEVLSSLGSKNQNGKKTENEILYGKYCH